MAYKQKGCTPITAKIQKGTKGGVVAPLLKAMGVPMKASPYKVNEGPAPEPNKDSDISMTPYSTETFPNKSGKRGKINGPKVSYDMAYEKASKTKRYANMSKADYIKEAKRQTKSFKGTGNWDAAKKKKETVEKVSTIKSEPVKTRAPKVSVESKLTKAPSYDTSKITGKSKASATAKPSKKVNRKQKAIDVKLTKAKAARASGNDRKADRKERAAQRKKDRLARK